jgi:hypothetical protein
MPGKRFWLVSKAFHVTSHVPGFVIHGVRQAQG